MRIEGLWPDMAAFRAEVLDFCARELPSDISGKVERNQHLERADYDRWHRILHAKGWFCGHWPVEQGGRGWTPKQRFVFEQALAEAGAPWLLPFGPAYVGPVIIEFGDDKQRKRFLPDILTSDIFWCQGYSEPGAGSDLAGLKTRAVRDGDHYVVTGQKTWTSYAHWADMMFCLARTDASGKPQQGISFLLLDMKSPGVRVRPIKTFDLCHHVNEVFLDEVRVPVENLVGAEGGGWTIAKFLLSNERMTVAETGKARRLLRQARTLAGATRESGRSLAEDPFFARRITEAEIALRSLEALCARQFEKAIAGAEPGEEASMLKIRGSELLQVITELALSAAGRGSLPYDPAQLEPGWNDAEREDDGTPLLREYFIQRAATIYGGSNEIQRNILAKSALRS